MNENTCYLCEKEYTTNCLSCKRPICFLHFRSIEFQKVVGKRAYTRTGTVCLECGENWPEKCKQIEAESEGDK